MCEPGASARSSNTVLYTVKASRSRGADHFVMLNPRTIWRGEDDVYYRFGQGPKAEWKGTLNTLYNDFEANSVAAIFQHPYSKAEVPCEVIFHKQPAQDREEFNTTVKQSNLIWKQKM